MKLIDRIAGRFWQRAKVARERVVLDEARRRYDLHPTVKLYGENRLYGGGRISIGEDSYLNVGTWLEAGEGTTLTIGRAVRVGQRVRINTTTVDASADASQPLPAVTGDVSVGDWVWIGLGSYIGPGVTIGENAVVGANSVVTRDVEPYEIVGGVPAKHIRFKDCRP